MTEAVRSLLELVSRRPEPDEREAVLGDLCEAGSSDWRSFIAVSSLVVRRHAALWQDWRPWLAVLAAGIYSSVRVNEIRNKTSVALLITAMGLMFGAWLNGALWAPNWMLIVPVSFTVLLSWRADSCRANSN